MSTSTTQAPTSVSIRQATTPEDIKAVIGCFDAYMEWLNVDVSFQNYEDEKKSLPGAYVPPSGALLLATDKETDNVLGCIALRGLKLDPKYAHAVGEGRNYCEMKRLFVYPKARGRQVARLLVRESMARARDAGYDDVVLDTLPRLAAALALYRSEGFEEISPYYYNPHPGVFFMKKALR